MTSKKTEKELIEQITNLLKEHPIVRRMFDKYNVDISYIQEIPMEFKDLDVSAKAKDEKIYINKHFLDDGNFLDEAHYLVHELTHILQQYTNSIDCDAQYDHYLDDPSEVEAFGNQIAFIAAYKNDEEADKYTDDLLDFHNFKGARRTRKRKELRGD